MTSLRTYPRRATPPSEGCPHRPVTDDPLPALALATTVAFLTLLQMGILENWFEVTRVTFVAWAMFAVLSKELDARVAS